MEQLLNSCRNVVKENYKGDLSDEVLDIVSVAVMALYLKDAKMAKEKLPDILQNLTIYAEDSSVLDMAHNRLNNFQEDDRLKNSNAAVVRRLDVEDDVCVGEKRFLLINMANSKTNTVEIIHSMIHELTHLYRFGGIEDNSDELKVYDGVSFARYNKNTGTLNRKHYQLEEGIVQRFANQTLNMFHDYLQGQKLERDSLLYLFRERFQADFYDSYVLQTSFLEILCEDKEFSDLIDTSFYDFSFPSKVSEYYNSVMGSSTSFSFFTRTLEKGYEYACSTDQKNAMDAINTLRSETQKFRVSAFKRAQKKKI